MAVPGLQAVMDDAAAARRAAKKIAKTPLPAASRVTTPKKTDEIASLEAMFLKRAFGALTEHFPRFVELLTQDDPKERRLAWEGAFKSMLVQRQAGMGGGGASPINLNFNFPDGDPPVDVTP